MAKVDNLKAFRGDKPVDGEKATPKAPMPEEPQLDEDVLVKFGGAIEMIEQNVDAIKEQSDLVDEELLADGEAELDDDEASVLEEAVMGLPEDVVETIQDVMADATFDDCVKIAQHIADEYRTVNNPDVFGGFLYRVATLAAPEPTPTPNVDNPDYGGELGADDPEIGLV